MRVMSNVLKEYDFNSLFEIVDVESGDVIFEEIAVKDKGFFDKLESFGIIKDAYCDNVEKLKFGFKGYFHKFNYELLKDLHSEKWVESKYFSERVEALFESN